MNNQIVNFDKQPVTVAFSPSSPISSTAHAKHAKKVNPALSKNEYLIKIVHFSGKYISIPLSAAHIKTSFL